MTVGASCRIMLSLEFGRVLHSCVVSKTTGAEYIVEYCRILRLPIS
jgi:hypothetical protein